jgi:MscS family membrane protein
VNINIAGRRITTVLFISLIFAISAGGKGYLSVAAQEPDSKNKEGDHRLIEDIAKNPLKPPDTSSPRATLKSFLDNTTEAYRLVMAAHKENMKAPGLFTSDAVRQMGEQAEQFFDRAVYCLDLSKVPKALRKNWGYEGVLFLKEIFDRIELPPFDEIPDAQAIKTEEEYKNAAGPLRWRIPNTEIVITRIEEGPRQGEFLFASDIIPRLDEFVEKVKPLPYKLVDYVSPGFLEFYDKSPGSLMPSKWERWMPDWSNAMYYYQTVWQWFLMVVVILAVLFVMWALYRLTARRISTVPSAKWIWCRTGVTLFAALVVHLVLHILADWVHITGPVLTVLSLTLPTVSWFLLALAAYQFGTAIGESIIASPRIDPHGINAGLIRGSSRFAGFAAAVIIIFHGLSSVGVSLVPLLAGLGVGGLAVALAARPTLENLIGGFMILLDRPYRVGQRVMVKGYDGNVEKIGWRSTRIRLRAGPQVTIPNEEMARLDIENIDRRPFIRRLANITITYNTPPEKVERAIQIIKDILDNHEGMDPGAPPWIFFDEFNADSLNIVVYYWYHPPLLEKFYMFSEKFNLQIMRAFEKEGIAFAFPTTTTYLTQGGEQPLRIQFSKAKPSTEPWRHS